MFTNRQNLIFILLFFSFIISCADVDQKRIKEIDLSDSSNSIVDSTSAVNGVKLYVAVSAMISPQKTFSLYKEMIDYISEKLEIPIEFKQRKTYAEVNELLKGKKLDFAFICTGAYTEAKKAFPIELLAVPVVEGKPFYNAYIIVNKSTNINSFEALQGKSFAFTDPISKTGYSYVVSMLKEKNSTTEKFFSKTIYTYAHDYSIQAVTRNMVEGATIDGLVYEYLKHFEPEKVLDIRVIHKSKDFGIPPFVVQPGMDKKLKEKLKNIMLNMHNDNKGKRLLHKIMIEKFIAGDDLLYR